MAQTSLAGRAFVALALMIGFYAMALGLASLLIWLTWIQFTGEGRPDIRGVIFCAVGAAVILYSIAPRIDRFEAPGPELEESEHPKLFALIRTIAAKTGQSMPESVYVVADANAFVTGRGGFMGIGSRRVMGIGLPLFDALSASELRSVLAHEFGHFYRGDTKLGPWIYKTRSAIGRTLENLGRYGSLLQLPFQWYGNFFLRITQSISRGQELQADELSCMIVGRQTAEDALVKLHRIGPLYAAYLENEVAAVVDAGFRPPLAAGFAHFCSAEEMVRHSEAAVQEELNRVEADVADSHPPLGERLAAIRQFSMASVNTNRDHTPASQLLSNMDEIERRVLAFLAPDKELEPITWQDAGEKVLAEGWRGLVISFGESLRGIKIKDLPRAIARREEFPGLVDTPDVPKEFRGQFAQSILGAALADSLITAGWRVDAAPGAAIKVVKDADVVEPFSVTNDLVAGTLAADAWRRRAEGLGIAMLDLASGNQKES